MPSARTRRRLEQLRQRRQRRIRVGAAVAAVVVVAAGVAWFTRDKPRQPRPRPSEVRQGSERIADRGDLTIASVAASYRAVYRVDDYAGGDHTVNTDVVHVQRPFDSRIERRPGEPPGRDASSIQISTFSRLSVPAVRGARATSIVTPPELASSDLRFDVALGPALERDLIEKREWRRVGGKPCRVFRTGGPVGIGELERYRVTSPEYADVCVDGRGFMVEELWVSDGRVLRRKLLVDLDVDAAIPARRLRHTGEPASPKEGGGSVRAVRPDTYPPGTSWLPTAAPAGFELRGRYAVIPPQPELRTEEEKRGTRTSIVDVWTRGGDLVLLDQGGTLAAVEVFRPDPDAQRVVAGEFGEADSIVGFRMNEVRVLLPRGRWLRIRGTLPPDELLAVATNLTKVESETDQLVYLD